MSSLIGASAAIVSASDHGGAGNSASDGSLDALDDSKHGGDGVLVQGDGLAIESDRDGAGGRVHGDGQVRVQSAGGGHSGNDAIDQSNDVLGRSDNGCRQGDGRTSSDGNGGRSVGVSDDGEGHVGGGGGLGAGQGQGGQGDNQELHGCY